MTTADTSAAGLVARIREREQAATPGPWRWRGNTDTGDPYLTSGGQVVTGGRSHHAGDVLGHIPHEITRAEAERAIGTGDVLVPQVAAEPAGTYATRCEAAASQAYEAALTEYMTGQCGQPRTEQRLAFRTDWTYTEARELAVYEVCPQAAGRDDPRVYRADITRIRHPDAEFVARSREDLAALLDVAERVLAIADRAEHGALRWADPLPVPGWVAEIREAVSGALAGQAGAL
jgi:hypothetical protein